MRYIWVLFQTAIWTTLLGTLGILISLIEPTRGKSLGVFARWWAKLILFFSGVRYSVQGLDKLDKNQSYVFAGNHASGFDILLGYAGLPFWIVSIAKKELRSIPVLGWVMRAGGHVFIDRSRHDSAMNTLDKTKQSLKETPRSIMLFPEGTRTQDGSLRPFKRGGLLVGVELKMPIVPVAYCGTFHLLGKDSWKMGSNPIVLKIGDPIPTDAHSVDSRRALAIEVQQSVQTLLDDQA